MYYVLHKLLFQATYYTYTGGEDRERGTAMQEGKKYSQVAGLIHAVVSQKYVASLSLLKITGTFFMQLAVDPHTFVWRNCTQTRSCPIVYSCSSVQSKQ